jgi:hypothetical protein
MALQTLWFDLMTAALFGALGGFGLGLVQEKGLALPRPIRASGVTFVNLGFIGDVLIGALAALLMYALNPPDDLLGMIAITIPAGIGGSGVFKGYLESSKASMQATRAEMYRTAAWDAMRGVDVQERLEDLQQSDEEIKRRWGPW